MSGKVLLAGAEGCVASALREYAGDSTSASMGELKKPQALQAEGNRRVQS